MTKILIFSDTHECNNSFEKIVKVGVKTCDFIICAGDIETFTNMDIPFFLVSGNHDKDKFGELLLLIDKGYLKLKNFINVLPGRVYFQSGLRIAGLPGNYSPKDYMKNREDLTHQRHFTKKEVEACMALGKVDIFIAHEAAYGVGDLDWKTNSRHFGVMPVKDILDTIQPKLLVTAHIHNQQMAIYKNTLVINPGYGVKGEFAILDTKLKEIFFFKELQLAKEIEINF